MRPYDARPARTDGNAPSSVVPKRTPGDDLALARAFVTHGDQAAFEALVERYHKWVFRRALSVLGPGAVVEAQDITQEVFLRLVTCLKHFRGDSAFHTWLYQLAGNLAIDVRRHPRWRMPHVSLEALGHRPSTHRDDDPFRSAAALEERLAIGESVWALPDEMRSVVHLRYWRGLPMDEIAARLQIPTGTVKSRLHRSRQLLNQTIRARGRARPTTARRTTRSDDCGPTS